MTNNPSSRLIALRYLSSSPFEKRLGDESYGMATDMALKIISSSGEQTGEVITKTTKLVSGECKWQHVATLAVIAAIRQPSFSEGWLAEMWRVFCKKPLKMSDPLWASYPSREFLHGMPVGMFRAVNLLGSRGYYISPDESDERHGFCDTFKSKLSIIPLRLRDDISDLTGDRQDRLETALGAEIKAWAKPLINTPEFEEITRRMMLECSVGFELDPGNKSDYTAMFFRHLLYADLAETDPVVAAKRRFV